MNVPLHRSLILFAACWFAVHTAVAAAAESNALRKPNVVIILADDQGWGDLSVHGNTNLRTPNIDSLARDGATFESFCVSPVCSPTRAEFLTGRYHPRTGVRGVSTGQERLNLDEKTIADAFKSAGYATGAFGKWHNGSQWPYHPLARGFDEYYGFTSGHWGEYFNPPLDHNGKPVRGNGYIVDDLTDHAMTFIEKNRDRRFFCYVPYNTPHSPFAVPEQYWQRFKDKPIGMLGSDQQREDLAVTRCALAMCESIDWNVGRVLRRLDELDLARDTIVVYFSDNGPNSSRWNGGMKGRKASTDEGGVRVPLFIRWPGRIGSGTEVREVAGAIDLLPTLTTLAQIALPGDKPLDGRDVSPLVLGTARDWSDRMIFAHQGGRVSARSRQYRLDSEGSLFDMAADPGQMRNVAAEHREVAAAMSKAVEGWRAEVLGAAGNGADGRLGRRRGDDRPFPVGYREFPVTVLPARDGVAHGGVRRSARAPNCSYFVNWTKPEDLMTWDVEVNTTGRYDVSVHYTCAEPDAGSLVEVAFNGSALSGTVRPAWDPPLYTDQDTIPRPAAESPMKEFRPLNLGTLRLEKGRGAITLRALKVPGKSVMDVRQISLTLLSERD